MSLKANQASEALIQYESGQEYVESQAMTDSGDHKKFTISEAPWSGRAGYEPVIRPNGIITGGEVTPGSSDDTVDVASLTCYLEGAEVEVSSSSGFSINRPATDVAKISSVTINDSGTITEVEGSEAADTTFSSDRDADGGPPWIPTGSIEIAQVRMTSSTAATFDSSQIRQIPGVTLERYDHPIWSEDPAEGEVEFLSELPTIHSDDSGDTEETKEVWAEVYTPIFADLEPSVDFVPPETTHSINSTQVYGGAIGSKSSSINQGSYIVYLKDGVTDPLLDLKNENLWHKFFPHRLKSPYLLVQGILGLSRTFPADDSIQASCTLTANQPAIEKSS